MKITSDVRASDIKYDHHQSRKRTDRDELIEGVATEVIKRNRNDVEDRGRNETSSRERKERDYDYKKESSSNELRRSKSHSGYERVSGRESTNSRGDSGKYYRDDRDYHRDYDRDSSRRRSLDVNHKRGRRDSSDIPQNEDRDSRRDLSLKKSKLDDHDNRSHKVKQHFLPMKGVEYLDYIKQKIKTHEGRVCRGTCSNMRVGDELTLKDKRAQKGIVCEIISWKKYDSFKSMLLENGVVNMLPQLKNFAKNATPETLLSEGIKIYEKFPGAQGVKNFGCVAIGVKYLKDC